MSQLLNRILFLRNCLRPTVLGTAFYSDGVVISMIRRDQEPPIVENIFDIHVNNFLDLLSKEDERRRVLSQVAGELQGKIKKSKLYELNISLPDYLLQTSVLKFKKLPSDRDSKVQIVTQRLKDDLGLSEEYHFGLQNFVSDREMYVLVVALKMELYQQILASFKKHDLLVSSLSGNICYDYNLCLVDLSESAGGGVLVGIYPDSWSLIIWGNKMIPEFTAGKRIGKNVSESEISDEIKRKIIGYTNKHENASIGNLYITGACKMLNSLSTSLSENLHNSAIVIDTFKHVDFSIEDIKKENIGAGLSAAIGM